MLMFYVDQSNDRKEDYNFYNFNFKKGQLWVVLLPE